METGNSSLDLQRRRELAAQVGCITREDYCALARITNGTEEAHRKRGKAPPYVVLGCSILYPTASLAEHMQTIVRKGQRNVAAEVL